MRRRSIRGPSDEAPTRRQGNLHRQHFLGKVTLKAVTDFSLLSKLRKSSGWS